MMKNAFKEFLFYIIGCSVAGALFGALGQALSYGYYKKSDLVFGFIVPPAIKIFIIIGVLIGVVIGVFCAVLEASRAMRKK
jgi:predicted benzoate:H+ symporter BenE